MKLIVMTSESILVQKTTLLLVQIALGVKVFMGINFFCPLLQVIFETTYSSVV